MTKKVEKKWKTTSKRWKNVEKKWKTTSKRQKKLKRNEKRHQNDVRVFKRKTTSTSAREKNIVGEKKIDVSEGEKVFSPRWHTPPGRRAVEEGEAAQHNLNRRAFAKVCCHCWALARWSPSTWWCPLAQEVLVVLLLHAFGDLGLCNQGAASAVPPSEASSLGQTWKCFDLASKFCFVLLSQQGGHWN